MKLTKNDYLDLLIPVALMLMLLVQSYTHRQIVKKYNKIVIKSVEIIESQDSILNDYEGMAEDYIEHLTECNKK